MTFYSYENGLIRKIWLIWKLQYCTCCPTSQQMKAFRQWSLVSWWQNIAWETFFLKIYAQNVVEKLSPDSFLKSQHLAYLWINSLKFYTVCFYCIPRWELLKYIETKLQITFLYLIYRFYKNKKCLGLVSLSQFLHDFGRKYFSGYILLTDRIPFSECFYFLSYWAIWIL